MNLFNQLFKSLLDYAMLWYAYLMTVMWQMV